jgi:hypothetical protein
VSKSLCVSLVLGFACVAAPRGAQAQVAPAAPSDIMDVQATSFVSAHCGTFTAMYAFDRRVVGSTVAPFSVPAGKVFVVTAFDWKIRGAVLDRNRTASLFRVIGGGLNGASAMSTGAGDGTGRAGGSATFPTGIVVENGTTLCIQIDGSAATDVVSGTVHGFLTDAR